MQTHARSLKTIVKGLEANLHGACPDRVFAGSATTRHMDCRFVTTIAASFKEDATALSNFHMACADNLCALNAGDGASVNRDTSRFKSPDKDGMPGRGKNS